MTDLLEILQREAVYIWYYFDVQLRQIFWYWLFGILIGSLVSVFAKAKIHQAAELLGGKFTGVAALLFASALGIASPLCMYGTIPICAAFSKKGVHDDFLASFMMSSILLNPQLILYSAALEEQCFFCGLQAAFFVAFLQAFWCAFFSFKNHFSIFQVFQNHKTMILIEIFLSVF